MGGLRVLGLVLALVVVPGGVAMSADCAALTKRAKIAECIGDDFQRADATLNSVYKRLMHGLGKTGQTGLRDAERAWIAFRDKHCAFVGGASAGGSIQAMVIGQCQTELTVDRVAQLAWQLHCAGTDAACAR